MSWYAIAWAETAPVADVYERAVLTFLAHRSRHSDGTGAYPSIATISKFAMCDERSVKRRLDALRERGLIALGDQALAKSIEPRYRPPVYDLLIPFKWFSESQRGDVNRERAERGHPPLSEAERPVILPVEKSRKPRSDRGVPRANKLAAGSAGDVPGLLVTPDSGTTGDPGVTNSAAQGCLVDPTRGDYETPKEVVKDLSLLTAGSTQDAQARQAALPPCGACPPIEVDLNHAVAVAPKVDDKTGSDADVVQIKFDAQDSDPFAGQAGDPDEAAAAVQGRKPHAVSKVINGYGRPSSPDAVALMNRYCQENPLPIRTRQRWQPEISSLLDQKYEEWAILVGLRVCFQGGLGHTLLADKVAAAVAQRSAPGRAASTEQRFDQIDDLLARRTARSATPSGLISSTPRQIEAQ
jgi:hypothetical protein